MKMKYLYMSFLLALVYSCSDSGDNSDYSEMLKKDFNQEIKWDVAERFMCGRLSINHLL